ncbi:hypothetical protein FF38_13139 [Lucilia cuprina]|uniref:Uncharacterized protein n=1 Tax=Lucilia cuprina TaxID=7375 RepID=A0A0L0C7M5_LUCCU|nr:hypothetical protein CVS40_5615 [Lucilia cuprina]KNC28285.1 hypothetical protein FF38_13139 [Lucilia cuprina]
MSTTQDAKEADSSATTSRCESPAFPLKHQHSFEERYAAIINQQILENTINKEVLQRQVQAFFPFSRSASRECTEGKKVLDKGSDSEEEEEDEDHDLERKVLQKLDTLDIKDKEQT